MSDIDRDKKHIEIEKLSIELLCLKTLIEYQNSSRGKPNNESSIDIVNEQVLYRIDRIKQLNQTK